MREIYQKNFVLLAAIFLVLTYIGNNLESGETKHTSPNKAQPLKRTESAPSEEIQIVVSKQDAQGVTPQQMDLNFLKNLELYILERTKIKTKEYLTEKGYPDEKLDINSEATFVETGSLKFAVIRLKGSDFSNSVMVVGIIGNELKRVLCARNSGGIIPITYGVCADKIKEVFGRKIGE